MLISICILPKLCEAASRLVFTLDDKFFGCFFDVSAASGGRIWSLAGQDGVLGFFPHTHAFLLCFPLPPPQVGPDIRNVGWRPCCG